MKKQRMSSLQVARTRALAARTLANRDLAAVIGGIGDGTVVPRPTMRA